MATSTSTRVHEAVLDQDHYARRRHMILHYFLRPIGLKVLLSTTIQGVEHVPASGPTLIVMNHIAALDPFVVTAAVTSRYVVPMSKIENYQHPIIGIMARAWGVYPVRRGEVDRQALASTITLLNQEYPVLIAPEGSRQQALSEAKDGMTYVALKANAVIVPVGIDGTEQFPHAYTRLRRPHVSITFGRAFRFKADSQKRVPREDMHEMTQQAMYQIAQLVPPHRRGMYHDLSQAATDRLEFV